MIIYEYVLHTIQYYTYATYNSHNVGRAMTAKDPFSFQVGMYNEKIFLIDNSILYIKKDSKSSEFIKLHDNLFINLPGFM